jgi:hypothetical protein
VCWKSRSSCWSLNLREEFLSAPIHSPLSGSPFWSFIIDDSHDDDDDTKTDTYYGQIEEIWELDYVGLKVALFRCRWVTNGKRAVSKDKYGYVSVDLRVFGYKNEPFVFANVVEQVFYVL